MPPAAGTPGRTFFDVWRAFFPTDLVGVPARFGMRDDWARAIILIGVQVE